jgi:NAD(P)-dependent dehydrogenase (short-subunit alcohol dehydrogenase family)
VKDRVATAEQVDGAGEEEHIAFFERTGEFDHLVLAFSPGAIGMGPIRETGLDAVRAAFDGKLFGYLAAIRHARVTGSITLISAASARAALPGTVALAAVNGAIERIVPPLAAELAPVRVNAVSPGVIDTPWWSFLPDDQRHAQFAMAAQSVPAGRVGQPDDVARAVSYLISATYVTGTILPVDGGFVGS